MHDGEPKPAARDPQAIAEEAGRIFAAEDRGTLFLGGELIAIAPGSASVRLVVKPHHLNSAKVCFGGFIFSIADAALGFASCSYGIQTLAQHADIHWLKPGREGDTLIAKATEVARTGRTAVYDIAVTNQSGELIATVRGMTRSTGLPVGADVLKK